MTGAAGFIGSHLCEALVAADHHVVGIDCFTDYYARTEKEANLLGLTGHPRFELAEVDLRTDPLHELVRGADAVINEAATPGLVLSWDDFERYQSCNLSAVKRLVGACLAEGSGTWSKPPPRRSTGPRPPAPRTAPPSRSRPTG